MRRRTFGLAVVLFAGLALVWTFPLVLHLSTTLPGAGAGDNETFLWNFWWMRHALASGSDVFRTSFLFAPVGVDLTLHTHTALSAFVGATVLGRLSTPAAQNLVILATLWLNGVCAWLLARRVVGDGAPALVAGAIFAGAPYLAAHLNGHFNLISAWSIPLFALAVLNALDRGWKWGVAAGLILGLTAYDSVLLRGLRGVSRRRPGGNGRLDVDHGEVARAARPPARTRSRRTRGRGPGAARGPGRSRGIRRAGRGPSPAG